jgi:hypothetical protein
MFGIGNLLRMCNAQKEKGVPDYSYSDLQVQTVQFFSDRSMYMQQRTGSFHESFPKNTFYRFLSNNKINWLRFTSLLSQKVAGTIEPLTDEKCVNAFVVDDTLFERSSCRKRRGRSKYLLSVNVMVGKEQKIPAKIVCVRNKNKKKDWIAFICTNQELSKEEIPFVVWEVLDNNHSPISHPPAKQRAASI